MKCAATNAREIVRQKTMRRRCDENSLFINIDALNANSFSGSTSPQRLKSKVNSISASHNTQTVVIAFWRSLVSAFQRFNVVHLLWLISVHHRNHRIDKQKLSTNVQLDQSADDFFAYLFKMCIIIYTTRSISCVSKNRATTISTAISIIVAATTNTGRTKFQSRIWIAAVHDDAANIAAKHKLRRTNHEPRTTETRIWTAKFNNETDHTQTHLRSHTATRTGNTNIKAFNFHRIIIDLPFWFWYIFEFFSCSAPLTAAPPQKHYKIVFIKAPAPPAPTAPNIPVQPLDEEKTLVYVLVKKPEDPPKLVIPTPPSTQPSKPEVYFIRYKAQVRHTDVTFYNKSATNLWIPNFRKRKTQDHIRRVTGMVSH